MCPPRGEPAPGLMDQDSPAPHSISYLCVPERSGHRPLGTPHSPELSHHTKSTWGREQGLGAAVTSEVSVPQGPDAREGWSVATVREVQLWSRNNLSCSRVKTEKELPFPEFPGKWVESPLYRCGAQRGHSRHLPLVISSESWFWCCPPSRALQETRAGICPSGQLLSYSEKQPCARTAHFSISLKS